MSTVTHNRALATRLNRPIEILHNVQTNELGEDSWQILYKLYAEIKPLAEQAIKEFDSLSFGHLLTEEYYIITCRFVKDVNNRLRIRFANRIFTIKRVINPYERNRILQIIALEVKD